MRSPISSFLWLEAARSAEGGEAHLVKNDQMVTGKLLLEPAQALLCRT